MPVGSRRRIARQARRGESFGQLAGVGVDPLADAEVALGLFQRFAGLGRIFVVGIAVGAVAALLLSHLVANLLFDVTPRDPLTYVGVAALLAATALLACVVPARQATRIDVLSALRAE